MQKGPNWQENRGLKKGLNWRRLWGRHLKGRQLNGSWLKGRRLKGRRLKGSRLKQMESEKLRRWRKLEER